jgi:hypothetical protein
VSYPKVLVTVYDNSKFDLKIADDSTYCWGEPMSAFLVGVLSSIIASCLLVIAGWFGSHRIRKILTKMLSRLVGVDIEQRFATQREAAGELVTAINKAREIDIFVGRGSELTRSTFDRLWNEQGSRLRQVRILIPDPEVSGLGSWFSDRELEMASHDRAYGDNLIAEQVKANIRYVARMVAGRPEFEVRLYDFPHLGRIIITDRVSFLTTYTDRQHGSASPCLMFNNKGPLYDFCKRIFDKAWLKATPISSLVPDDV